MKRVQDKIGDRHDDDTSRSPDSDDTTGDEIDGGRGDFGDVVVEEDDDDGASGGRGAGEEDGDDDDTGGGGGGGGRDGGGAGRWASGRRRRESVEMVAGNSPCYSGGLHMPDKRHISDFVRRVKRLRYLSQCVAPHAGGASGGPRRKRTSFVFFLCCSLVFPFWAFVFLEQWARFTLTLNMFLGFSIHLISGTMEPWNQVLPSFPCYGNQK